MRPDLIFYTDRFGAYDVLDVSDFNHLRINHLELFVENINYIYGIENFWDQDKRHLGV